MTNTIPISSSINELDNNNDEINLDEIIDNQVLYDHKFSKYLINNDLLKDFNKNPNLDELYYYHINEFCKQLFTNSYIINFLEIFNIIIMIFLSIGFILPSKIILYHIMLSMIILIMYDIMDDNNFLINKFSNFKNNITLVPLSLKLSRFLLFNLMLISILSLSFPKYSIFNLINNLFINLKKYN